MCHMGYITVHSSAKDSKSFWTVWNHHRLLLYLSELSFTSYKWLLLEETVSKAYSVNLFYSFFVFIAITSASAEILTLRIWRLEWMTAALTLYKKATPTGNVKVKVFAKVINEICALVTQRDSKRLKKDAFTRDLYLTLTVTCIKQGMDYQRLAWCF